MKTYPQIQFQIEQLLIEKEQGTLTPMGKQLLSEYTELIAAFTSTKNAIKKSEKNMPLFGEGYVKRLLAKMNNDEISFGKFVDLLNAKTEIHLQDIQSEPCNTYSEQDVINAINKCKTRKVIGGDIEWIQIEQFVDNLKSIHVEINSQEESIEKIWMKEHGEKYPKKNDIKF